MKIDLSKDWEILQDVHDSGEALEIYRPGYQSTSSGNQMSEWEPIKELRHLQLVYAQQPYYGRELRYFNQAPWWYRKTFRVLDEAAHCTLWFTNVEYYCKVWVNGVLMGEHEGYSAPFSFRLDDVLLRGAENTVVVKVSSPWDDTVEGNMEELRTFFVRRNMVKGTYEHSDTFIQRDVNPIGIYGSVFLEIRQDAGFAEDMQVSYQLNTAKESAFVSVSAKLCDLRPDGTYRAHLIMTDETTKLPVSVLSETVKPDGTISFAFQAEHIRLWNIWDRGNPFLYGISLTVSDNGSELFTQQKTVGFRTVELERTPEKTTFILNGKPVFIRGTSYYPDVYLSTMTYERYQRDLLAIKDCGFNLVRVHVHVEFPEFYSLCDEMGIAVVQDSEYNWRHNYSEEFTQRFIRVYLENIRMLKHHPSIVTWVCMNEPGQLENVLTEGISKEGLLESIPKDGNDKSPIMTTYFGPQIYEAILAEDANRPIIMGSYCTHDPLSGDSHNYVGSLFGDKTHYSDIYGTTEKLNTEYGIDALPVRESLQKDRRVYQRLKKLEDHIGEIQQYQYALLKYFTEHYRMQKYVPCSGYVQFLFSDIGPQSYYGLYDWWGIPKKGLKAMLESNMPVGIFLKYGKDGMEGIYAVNDSPAPLGNCTVSWVVVRSKTEIVERKECCVEIGADTLVKVTDMSSFKAPNPELSVSLALTSPDGWLIARNLYENLFEMPKHCQGHPSRMSHELGVRLFWA